MERGRATTASAAAEQPVRAAAWLAGLALLFFPAAALRGTPAFRLLLLEDGVYEWLQAACLGATAVLAARGARRAAPRSMRRAVLAAAALAVLFVVGEELAWGTRLLDLRVESVQALNHQHEVTLHNVGRGLEASFLAMATVSGALAAWQLARRNFELAFWFAVPALYAAVRLLLVTPSYEMAKLSEVVELAFAVAALRLVRTV